MAHVLHPAHPTSPSSRKTLYVTDLAHSDRSRASDFNYATVLLTLLVYALIVCGIAVLAARGPVQVTPRTPTTSQQHMNHKL